MYCTKCGSEVDSRSKFCGNCGASASERLKDSKELLSSPVVK